MTQQSFHSLLVSSSAGHRVLLLNAVASHLSHSCSLSNSALSSINLLTRNPFHAGLKRRNEETEPIIERVSFHEPVGFLRPLEGLFSL